METASNKNNTIKQNKKHSRLSCFFGCHKYEVYKEGKLFNTYGNIIGEFIINRCTCCGKLEVVDYNTIRHI